MSGLAAIHLGRLPNDRDPVSCVSPAASTHHRLIENARKFASLPISASCGFEVGNIMLPLGISPLHMVSKGPRPETSRDRRAAQQATNRKGAGTIVALG